MKEPLRALLCCFHDNPPPRSSWHLSADAQLLCAFSFGAFLIARLWADVNGVESLDCVFHGSVSSLDHNMINGEWTAFTKRIPIPVATQNVLQYCLTFTQSCTHSYTDGGVNHTGQHFRSRQGEASCSRTPQRSEEEPGGARDRTSNLPVTGQPALPPEPHAVILHGMCTH